MEYRRYKPGRSISYTITTDPAKNSGQPAHARSLIKVFVGPSAGSQGSNSSSSGQRRLRSACATAQADLSLRWAHMQSCRKCCAPTRMLPITARSVKVSFRHMRTMTALIVFRWMQLCQTPENERIYSVVRANAFL